MQIGAHISAAGGVFNAPLNAAKISAECFQFFSRSPQGGTAPQLTNQVLKQFKTNAKSLGLTNYYIHAPYYVNLASTNPRIYNSSISVLRDELDRGSLLNAKGMMFHIGSAKDLNQTQALNKTVKALKQIVKNYKGFCQPLLEISAGAGNIIGDSFEELAEIINKTETKQTKNMLGICFDTAHAFASGYDLRTATAVSKTFNKFDKIIGLSRLKLIHANDSKTELGSHKDRHDHIGFGKIGKPGFKALINYKPLKNIDLILETPTDEGIVKDIKLLKKFRDNS